MFNILSCIYLFLISMLYFLLLCDMFYSVSTSIMVSYGKDDFAPKEEVDFEKFSMFYTSVIIILPVTGLIFIKNMDVVNKITQYGVYAIYLYVIFILYVFATNIKDGNLVIKIQNI